MYRNYIICLLLLFSCSILKAQTSNFDLTRPAVVTPPSPNVASLMKFVDVPVSYYTGKPQIDFPLYDLKTGFTSVNIALSYNAEGLKVEDDAPWTGLGWNLIAGGAISRSVVGKPDEQAGDGYNYVAQQKSLPLYPTTSAGSWLSSLSLCDENAITTGQQDFTPDQYYMNFNGHSAKLYFDQNGNPYISPYKAWKITGNVSSGFVVTIEDGTIYEFKAIEATNLDVSGSSESMGFTSNYNSSWMLTKIKSANQADSIVFSYRTINTAEASKNPSETRMDLVPGTVPGGAAPCSAIPATGTVSTETSNKTTSTLLLTSIEGIAEKITFIAQNSRQDADDGETLQLGEIQVYDKLRNVMVKDYKLDYGYFGNTASSSTLDKRLMLTDFKEMATTDSLTTSFSYINPTGVPSKNSKAQDNWGFYNGKSSNTTLIPAETDANGVILLTGADRSSQPILPATGMLSQITYPTGGTVNFTYETNDYSFMTGSYINSTHQLDSAVVQTTLSANTNTLTTSSGTVTKTLTIMPGTENASVTYQLNGRIPNDPQSDASITENGHTIFTASPTNGVVTTLTSPPLLPGHTYQLIVSRTLSTESAVITATYYTKQVKSPRPIFHSLLAGGVRIKTIVEAGNADTTKNMIRQFKYTIADTVSSGYLSNLPVYQGINYVPYYCMPSVLGVNGPPTTNVGYIQYYTRHSAPMNTLGSTQGSVVGYSKVTVLYGNSGQNGKEEFYYTTSPYDLASNGYPYSPPTSYDDLRGLLTRHVVYDNSGRILKASNNNYNLNTGAGSPNFKWTFGAKIGAQKVSDTFDGSGCPQGPLWSFIGETYTLYQFWPVMTSTTDSVLNTKTNQYLTSVSNLTLSPTDLQLTKEVHFRSNGDSVVTKYTYPPDYAGQTVYNGMISQNIIDKVIQKTIFTNTTQNYQQISNYYLWSSGLYAPQTVSIQNGTNPAETRYNFYNYDSFGNILEESKTTAAHDAYQWGYNYQYLTASAKNASANDIFYDSFEEGDGNSTAGDAKTGHYSHTGAYSKTLAGVDNGTYNLSYWQETSPGIWVLQRSQVVVNTGSFIIGLSGQIDDVRFYPALAQMTTYTYDPIVGMTSSTDAKNEVTYYEYDNFQRLMNVKDKDGNIIKHTDYHYANH